jgi:hypothetical protein
LEISICVTELSLEILRVTEAFVVDPAPPLMLIPKLGETYPLEPPPPPEDPEPLERVDAGLQSVTTAQFEQSKLSCPEFVPDAEPVNCPEELMMTPLKSM